MFSTAARLATKKWTTGLVGIPVNPYGRAHLKELLGKTNEAISQLPECTYKNSVKALTAHRMSVVDQHQDVAQIEAAIDCGEIEELILQQEREIQLIETIKETKAWEPLVEDAPENQWRWPI